MNNQIDAFPNRNSTYTENGSIIYPSGMSLRDYFAAQALTGIIAHPNGSAGDWDRAAKDAYLAADAVLIARGTTS